MRWIEKGVEPAALAGWKHEHARAGAALPGWEHLPGDVATALRAVLFDEQGHLCCYCGRRIVQGDSHIEHIVPRDGKTGDPSRTYDHDNLVASCQGNLLRGDPIHCGRKKGNWYDAELFVSPLSRDCEGRFHFELDGRVRAAEAVDLAADETIRRLDLDGARLRALRRKAIEGLFDGLTDDLTPEEHARLALAFGQRDERRMFAPFCFVLTQVLVELAGLRG